MSNVVPHSAPARAAFDRCAARLHPDFRVQVDSWFLLLAEEANRGTYHGHLSSSLQEVLDRFSPESDRDAHDRQEILDRFREAGYPIPAELEQNIQDLTLWTQIFHTFRSFLTRLIATRRQFRIAWTPVRVRSRDDPKSKDRLENVQVLYEVLQSGVCAIQYTHLPIVR